MIKRRMRERDSVCVCVCFKIHCIDWSPINEQWTNWYMSTLLWFFWCLGSVSIVKSCTSCWLERHFFLHHRKRVIEHFSKFNFSRPKTRERVYITENVPIATNNFTWNGQKHEQQQQQQNKHHQQHFCLSLELSVHVNVLFSVLIFLPAFIPTFTETFLLVVIIGCCCCWFLLDFRDQSSCVAFRIYQ